MEKTINDEFMQHVVAEQAWKKLSEDFAWTEALLAKYSENVDWKLISDNENIYWSLMMLQKYSNRLDWKVLSRHVDCDWFTEAHLEAFKNKWDWTGLVCNYKFSERLIDKYIDYVDWDEIIGVDRSYYGCQVCSDDNFDAIAFYEKYKKHIPMSKFQGSALWERIVEQKCRQLKVEIMS